MIVLKWLLHTYIVGVIFNIVVSIYAHCVEIKKNGTEDLDFTFKNVIKQLLVFMSSWYLWVNESWKWMV